MQTTSLGPFTIGRLALGTMHMGAATPPDEAHRVLDRFVEAGGSLVDSADVYGDGESERTLAPWLAAHRDDVVLATKVRFAVSDPGGEGLAPERIERACEASLRRLGVDTIDLYQVHAPDPGVPLESTLEALDRLVRAGKVRTIGASNFPAWLLAWALATQDREGWAPFVSLQPQYSLVERSVETEILPLCRATGVATLPWGPLGAGFLSGRYRRGEQAPPGSRIAEADGSYEEAQERRATGQNFAVVEAAEEIAAARGATVPQVALAWLLATPGVTAPVTGPRTVDQLDDLLGADALGLDAAELARLEAPLGPPATYPQRMLREQCGIADVATVRRPDRERATAPA